MRVPNLKSRSARQMGEAGRAHDCRWDDLLLNFIKTAARFLEPHLFITHSVYLSTL